MDFDGKDRRQEKRFDNNKTIKDKKNLAFILEKKQLQRDKQIQREKEKNLENEKQRKDEEIEKNFGKKNSKKKKK